MDLALLKALDASNFHLENQLVIEKQVLEHVELDCLEDRLQISIQSIIHIADYDCTIRLLGRHRRYFFRVSF